MSKALFLDRDGVVNIDVGYAYLPEQVQFIEGIFELCKHYQNLGYQIIIVTNQSGIARGYYSEAQFQALSEWFTAQFKQHDIVLNAIYHCPHHPDFSKACNCRKPAPGMLLQAIADYQINPKDSIMIGDKHSDMQAAKAAGISQRIYFSQQTAEDNDSTKQIKELSELLNSTL